jgi:hypothetical protein
MVRRRRSSRQAQRSVTLLTQPPGYHTDVNVSQLRRHIGSIGSPDEDLVYGYVVATVRPQGAGFLQLGSGPNFDGGLVTLGTCKHAMRASLSPTAWTTRKWVAGLTGWNAAFKKQQSLVYLMRVGAAYDSQAHLVQALRDMGRADVVDAKDASRNPLGDVMVPLRSGLPAHPYDPAAYRTPLLGHVHRHDERHTAWHDDIDYGARGGRRPAMLVGEPGLSFIWTHAMVARRQPGPTRPYRVWTLSQLLDDLDEATA